MKKLFIYSELRYRASGGETGAKEGAKMSNVWPDPEIFCARYIVPVFAHVQAWQLSISREMQI